jgi:hypothetical protein
MHVSRIIRQLPFGARRCARKTIRTLPYFCASLKDFCDHEPVTTKSARGFEPNRFIGTMAFSPSPPPCRNRMRWLAGTSSRSRRSVSASSWIVMNSLPRWLISITLMPLPCQLSISSAACRSTSSGMAAGPAEKLKTRM